MPTESDKTRKIMVLTISHGDYAQMQIMLASAREKIPDLVMDSMVSAMVAEICRQHRAKEITALPAHTTALRYIEKIVPWLSPHCERIEVAGSIRRARQVVNDIDLVCIPKVTQNKDLLGEATDTKNHLWEFLIDYVKNHPSYGKPPQQGEQQVRVITGGETPGKQMIIQGPKCQLDLWFADETNFAIRLLMRTGSKEHNVWLAERARQRNGHWKPYEGLTLSGALIPCADEKAIYHALGLEYIDPKNRERDWIAKHLEFGL